MSRKKPIRGLDMETIRAEINAAIDDRLAQAKAHAIARVTSARGDLQQYAGAAAETASDVALGSTTVSTPASGDTVVCPGGNRRQLLVLNPSSALAALTIALPASPLHGDRVRVVSTRAITALTWDPGAGNTVVGAPGLWASFGNAEFAFVNGTTKTWVRVA